MALPVGHALVGLAIARKTKVDPKLAVVLANLSDIDYFFGLFFAGGNMMAYHRSPLTHSPPFAVFITLLFFLYGTLIRQKPYTQRQLIGIFLIVLSHWVLDYGMMYPIYKFDITKGTNGLFDFLFAHIISLEALYNYLVDLLLYGSVYLILVRFIFKEKKLV